MTPARPEIEKVKEDEEQYRQPGHGQRDYRSDRVNNRSDKELTSDLPYFFRCEAGIDQPIPVSCVPPHDVDKDTDDGQDSTVERGGNRLVHFTVERFGEYGGWERQKCDQHQVEDIQQQQRSIYPDDVVEHGVVIHPDCANHQKADYVGKVGWPELEEFCPEHCIRWRHFDFEHQQGDCDREDPIAKCFQAGGLHAHLLCE